MLISDLYNKLHLPASLIDHQYKVASLAYLLGNNFTEKVNVNLIVSAALLHDVGYMVWLDIDKFSVNLEAEEKNIFLEYQKKLRKKYGNDGNVATYAILTDLGVSSQIVELIRERKEYNFEKNVANRSKECLILHYSDLRVSPKGLMTIQNRLIEWKGRRFDEYRKHKPNVSWIQLSNYMLSLEPEIQKLCKINLQNIGYKDLEYKKAELTDWKID